MTAWTDLRDCTITQYMSWNILSVATCALWACEYYRLRWKREIVDPPISARTLTYFVELRPQRLGHLRIHPYLASCAFQISSKVLDRPLASVHVVVIRPMLLDCHVRQMHKHVVELAQRGVVLDGAESTEAFLAHPGLDVPRF